MKFSALEFLEYVSEEVLNVEKTFNSNFYTIKSINK